MSRSPKSGRVPEPGGAPAGSPPRHFDTFETRFFEQGDAAPPPSAADSWGDLEAPQAKRRRPYRKVLLAVAIGAAAALALAGAVLLRGERVSPKPEVPELAPPVEPAPSGLSAPPAEPAPSGLFAPSAEAPPLPAIAPLDSGPG